MITEELEKALDKINDAEKLAYIAHRAMARACVLWCTLEAESEAEFRIKGNIHLITKMKFEMVPVGEKGGES